MPQTQQSDRILPVLTAPEVYEQKLVGHRYFVELASKQWELQDNRSVPVRTQVVDCLVAEASKDAIAQLLATSDWLKDYSVVCYREPSFLEAPF